MVTVELAACSKCLDKQHQTICHTEKYLSLELLQLNIEISCFCIFRNACNVKQEFDVAGIAGMTQLETENSIQSITPILLNRLRVIFCLASVVKSKLCILCSILTPVTATFYRNSNLCLACLALRVMQVMWKLAIIRIPESTMRAPGPNRSTRWAKMTTINNQTTDEATTRAV